jgi:hypothetical protein
MTSAAVTFIEQKDDKLVHLTIKFISADALPLVGDSVFLIAGYQHKVIERHFTYGDTLNVAIYTVDVFRKTAVQKDVPKA